MIGSSPLSADALSSLGGVTYTLSCSLGTFAVSGSSATFTLTHKLPVTAGTYATTGNTAAFLHASKLATTLGTYSVSGSTATLAHGSKLATSLGTYSTTGNTVSFHYSGAVDYQLSPDAGAYSTTGNSASFYKGWKLQTAAGSYSVTGNSAVTGHNYHLNVVAGSYSTTGSDLHLQYSGGTYKLITSAGSYSITGSSGTLVYQRRLSPVTGQYEWVGVTPDLFYNQGESFTLNFLLDLLPAEAAFGTEYSCRLLVDDEEIKVKEFTYREEAHNLTGLLDVTLANVDDRDLILTTSTITFDIAQDGGEWERIVDTGKLGISDYSISRQGIGPDDTFTLTTKPYELVKLQTSFASGGVVYDPRQVEINESDWPTITASDGSVLTPEFVAIYGLTWRQVATAAFVNVAGFGGVSTNIPDFPVSIAEFRPGEPVVNIVGALIGGFEPDFSAQDGVLFIRDGTTGTAAGMPTPRSLTTANATRIGVNLDQSVHIDGILLTYQADTRSFDSSSNRVETATSASGSGDSYTETTTTKTYVDYYRNSFPGVPQRTELLSVATDVYHTIKVYEEHAIGITDPEHPDGPGTYVTVSTTLELNEQVLETFYYNAKGLLYKRIKTGAKRLPMPEGDTVPTAEIPSPSKTTDTFTTDNLVDAVYEIETVNYKVHPFKRLHLYIADREVHTSGIIYVDVDNPQLDIPYAQDANKVYEAGNVTTSSIPTWGAIHSYIETGTPLRGGQVRMHVLEIDQVAGTVNDNRDEWREGELGISQTIKEPREVLVGTHSSGVIDTLHAGEAPLNIAIPLASRVLRQRRTLTRKAGFQLPYVDLSIKKGSSFVALGRDGDELGTYVVEARQIVGTKQFYQMSVTARQAA
jgi:hypothetical protein